MKVIRGKYDDGYIDVISSDYPVLVGMFYNLLIDYSGYWQLNTPTAFGNPDFNFLEGKVLGFLMAKNWEMDETDTCITIRSGKRVIIELIKPALPKSYFESIKDINETLRGLGI